MFWRLLFRIMTIVIIALVKTGKIKLMVSILLLRSILKRSFVFNSKNDSKVYYCLGFFLLLWVKRKKLVRKEIQLSVSFSMVNRVQKSHDRVLDIHNIVFDLEEYILSKEILSPWKPAIYNLWIFRAGLIQPPVFDC